MGLSVKQSKQWQLHWLQHGFEGINELLEKPEGGNPAAVRSQVALGTRGGSGGEAATSVLLCSVVDRVSRPSVMIRALFRASNRSWSILLPARTGRHDQAGRLSTSTIPCLLMYIV